jgi:hypothetical protein
MKYHVNKIYTKLFILSRIINVMQPFSNLRVTYDIIMLLTYYSMLFFISIILCFRINLENSKAIKCFYLMMMLIEILIKLNTGYLKRDVIIKKRMKILKNYVTSSEFYIDILVIFPLLYDTMNKNNFLMILCFLNIQSISIITQKINNFFNL